MNEIWFFGQSPISPTSISLQMCLKFSKLTISRVRFLGKALKLQVNFVNA